MFHKWLVYPTFFVLIPVHLLINGIEEKELIAGYIHCDEEWFLFGGMCYKVFGQKAMFSWHDASKNCKNLGGHLATVQSKEIQEFLFTYLLLEKDTLAWIGLNDIENESHYVWDDGTEYNYSNWNLNEPSGLTDEAEDCVVMKFGITVGEPGEWNDRRCEDGIPYICQVEEGKQRTRSRDPTLCSSGMGGGWKFEDSCYNIVKRNMSWKEAEKYCQDQYSGHLVKVLNFNVDYFLKYIMSNFNTDTWIGIKIKDQIHQHYSSGWFLRNTYWRESPENFVNNTCVMRTNERLWEIVSCTEEYPFICEVSTVSPTVLKQSLAGSKCPDGQNWMDLGGDRCYFIDTKNAFNFYQAQSECIGRGGSLASIHSKEELDALAPYLRHAYSPFQNFTLGYWIGLYRSPANKSVFLWTDGSKTDYTHWAGGEPSYARNEPCVEMWLNMNLRWNDFICSYEKRYICSVRKVSPNVTATVTECDCLNGAIFVVFLGMTTISIIFVVILMSVVIYYLRLWRKKRRNRSIVTPISLQTLDPSTPQLMQSSSCEQCRKRIIENDYHVYEYLDLDSEYETVD